MQNNILQMTEQIRRLIAPDRRGGVSASELGKALAILNSIDVEAERQQTVVSKYIGLVDELLSRTQ